MSNTARFRVTVWRDVARNWSADYAGNASGYGRAFARAQYYTERFGGNVQRLREVWPDIGSTHPVATRCGKTTASVQYL